MERQYARRTLFFSTDSEARNTFSETLYDPTFDERFVLSTLLPFVGGSTDELLPQKPETHEKPDLRKVRSDP